MSKFKLPDSFIEEYKDRPVKWGYGALSETVFLRSYSQLKEDGTKERWYEACRRVIEAMFDIQKEHCRTNKLPWNQQKAQRSAKDAYERLFEFKWTPPGRGLARMGTPIVDKIGSLSLFNCSSVTTEEFVGAMEYLMDAAMLGVGIGYDTKAVGRYTIHEPMIGEEIYLIPDSREGWVESTRKILMGYIHGEPIPAFDYSAIRPKGEPIKSGGIAPGPAPLILLHERLFKLFTGRGGELLTITDVVDVGNMIGACVVSGGNRRTALIAVDDSFSDEFLELKDLEKNPRRSEFAWASNNSVQAEVGQDLSMIIDGIIKNGEPGVVWTELAQNYGRLIDPPDYKDTKATIVNPCGEILLESVFDKSTHKAGGEVCNLSTINLNRHNGDMQDYLRTIKYAFLYNKVVTLIPTHNEFTNSIALRNRRIGASPSGVANFIDHHGMVAYREWVDKGYEAICKWDETYSAWLGVRESLRKTTVKPDGSMSTLSGESPGVHFSLGGKYFIRRVEYTKGEPVVEALRKAGYRVVPSIRLPDSFEVVEFPIKSGAVRMDSEVTAFEKMMIAAETQAYWSDNLVSCTVSFDPDTEGPQLGRLLQLFDGKLKGISFLPSRDHGYKQLPYEGITEEEYLEMVKDLKPVDYSSLYDGKNGQSGQGDQFCTTDACEAPDLTVVETPESNDTPVSFKKLDVGIKV